MAENTLFDPDRHTEEALKSFNEFVQMFDLRYKANYPDPPRASMETAIERWKIANKDEKPSLQQYDGINAEWQSKDRVANFLGLFSSKRFISDFKVAIPDAEEQERCTWKELLTTMRNFYKPIENLTLKNFQFRSLVQMEGESFTAFCNRVDEEAKHCDFKCNDDNCSAETTAVRDQVVIGLKSDKIREEALKNSWELADLRKNGMRLESATKGAAEISGDSTTVNKLGKYSFKNIKEQKKNKDQRRQQNLSCFYCGNSTTFIKQHLQQCPAKSSTCSSCGKVGHYAKVCRNKKEVREIQNDENSSEEEAYNIRIFRITEDQQTTNQGDFKTILVINNCLDVVLADTGAHVSVCSLQDAKNWGIFSKMVKRKAKIKPYNSPAIPVSGIAGCAVANNSRSVPVLWNIIDEKCELVLSRKKAEQLGVIKFFKQNVFKPINMIKGNNNDKENIQNILKDYPDTFKGIGELKHHQVKLHIKEDFKPILSPLRPIPYHFRERVQEQINEMLANDIIEEQPVSEPAPWVSNMVIAPKGNGEIRITLDARNINKALISSNLPIPRHEDIKSRLTGCRVFSKLDLKSAF